MTNNFKIFDMLRNEKSLLEASGLINDSKFIKDLGKTDLFKDITNVILKGINLKLDDNQINKYKKIVKDKKYNYPIYNPNKNVIFEYKGYIIILNFIDKTRSIIKITDINNANNVLELGGRSIFNAFPEANVNKKGKGSMKNSKKKKKKKKKNSKKQKKKNSKKQKKK